MMTSFVAFVKNAPIHDRGGFYGTVSDQLSTSTQVGERLASQIAGVGRQDSSSFRRHSMCASLAPSTDQRQRNGRRACNEGNKRERIEHEIQRAETSKAKGMGL
jgi:hypothetical protein